MGKRSAIRLVGFVAIGAAALIITFGIASNGADGAAIDDGVKAALATFRLNDVSAESAPQQSVTAQWAAKDLLAVIARGEARESTALGTKVPLLLLLGVLALCWHGATIAERAPSRRRGQGSPPRAVAGSTSELPSASA